MPSPRSIAKRTKTVPFADSYWEAKLNYWGSRCYMCGRSNVLMTKEHIKPLMLGGPHMPCNWRPACRACNKRKGANWPYKPSVNAPPCPERKLP